MSEIEFYVCINNEGRKKLDKSKIYQVAKEDISYEYIVVDSITYFKRRFKKLQRVYKGV